MLVRSTLFRWIVAIGAATTMVLLATLPLPAAEIRGTAWDVPCGSLLDPNGIGDVPDDAYRTLWGSIPEEETTAAVQVELRTLTEVRAAQGCAALGTQRLTMAGLVGGVAGLVLIASFGPLRRQRPAAVVLDSPFAGEIGALGAEALAHAGFDSWQSLTRVPRREIERLPQLSGRQVRRLSDGLDERGLSWAGPGQPDVADG